MMQRFDEVSSGLSIAGSFITFYKRLITKNGKIPDVGCSIVVVTFG